MALFRQVSINSQHRQVAAGYDLLDPFYRRILAGRVHHGMWENDEKISLQDALRATEGKFMEFAQLERGMRVCDVGCGYGVMAREWVKQCGVKLTAVTNSTKQAENLRGAAGMQVVLGDWLESEIEERFDRVVAMESLEHFVEFEAALRKMAEAVLPHGEMVLACWTINRGWLRDVVKRCGNLHGLDDRKMLERRLDRAGLQIIEQRDFSAVVKRTWSALIEETFRVAASDLRFSAWLLRHGIKLLPATVGSLAAASAFARGEAGYYFIRLRHKSR